MVVLGWKARWKAGLLKAEARSDRAMPLSEFVSSLSSPMEGSMGQSVLLQHLDGGGWSCCGSGEGAGCVLLATG